MSDANKATLKRAKAAAAAGLSNTLFSSTVATRGLPANVRVVTNASAIARFPLPLTLGGAVIAAIGVLATMKGHRFIGVSMMILGGGAIGAAGAAPEISSALKNVGGP